MREITPEEQDFLSEVLANGTPTQEQFLKVAAILKSIVFFSIQPHPDCPFYEWKKYNGHHYCTGNNAVYVSTNIMDGYFFMTGPLGWQPVEIDSAEQDICTFLDVASAAKAFGDMTVIIDFQVDSKKNFFMYKTKTMELTVGKRG